MASKFIVPFELPSYLTTPADTADAGFALVYIKNYWFTSLHGGTERDMVLHRPLDNFNSAGNATPVLSTDTVLEAINKVQRTFNTLRIVGDVTGSAVYQNGGLEIVATLGGVHAFDCTDVAGCSVIISLQSDVSTLQTAVGGMLKVATPFNTLHYSGFGNEYKAGDIVYYQGHLFRAKFNNDAITPAIGGNTYWADLGAGNQLRQSPIDWNNTTGDFQILNKPVALSQFINDLGFISSYTETDPIFMASAAAGITNTNISNWNTAYGWGNHASAGYLTTILAAATYIPLSQKGANNGVATLDTSGKVPSTQLPSYVDDVLEYTNLASFPATGETGKIYIDLATNLTYRWSGSTYVSISSAGSGGVVSVNSQTGIVSLTTYNIPENTNLYYTDARVKSYADTLYPSLTGSYSNPSWITSLAWSKITGAPSFLTAETDTLHSVTTRGNTTTNNITVNALTANGLLTANADITLPGNIYFNGVNFGAAILSDGYNITSRLRQTNRAYAIEVWNTSQKVSFVPTDTSHWEQRFQDDTGNAVNIAFVNSSTAFMNVFASNNIGIGVGTDYGYKLHVSGFFALGPTAGHNIILGPDYILKLLVSNTLIEQSSENIRMFANNTGYISLATQLIDRLIVFNGGDIGIGTNVDAGYKLDVNGTVRSTVYYSTNGTTTAPVIKFSASNEVHVDVQGYGATMSHYLKVASYLAVTGRIEGDGGAILKASTSTLNSPFVLYGIGRPDAPAGAGQALAGIGGIFDGPSLWSTNIGLSFFVKQATDLTDGVAPTEKMRITSAGDVKIHNLAGTGTRMVVADTNGFLSTQAIPSGGSGSVTSVDMSVNTSGTDVAVTGGPITSSGSFTLSIPSASTTARGVVTTGVQTFTGAKTMDTKFTVDVTNTNFADGNYSEWILHRFTTTGNLSNINTYNLRSGLYLNLDGNTYSGSTTYNVSATFSSVEISGGSGSTQPFRANLAVLVGKAGLAAMNVADFRFYEVKAPDAGGASGTHNVTNAYGLYIGDIDNASGFNITNAYGIYQVGAMDLNYFAGDTTFNKLATGSTKMVTVDANGKLGTTTALSLTTTGNSGAATYVGTTLNIPNYTADGILPSQTGNSGKYLTTNGTTVSWGTISAMTNPMTTLGDTIYGGASGTPTALAGNITTTQKFLGQVGNGTVSAAPTWFDLFGTANTWSARQTISATNGILFTYASSNVLTHMQSYVRTTANGDHAMWLSTDSSGNYKAAVRLAIQGTGTGSGVLNLAVNQQTTGTTLTPYITADGSYQSVGIFVKTQIGATAGTTGILSSAAKSTLDVIGSLSVAVVAKTATYTATISDHTILCNATSGAITINLPAASGIAGRMYVIKKTDSSANAVTVDANASETIDGSLTYPLSSQNKYVRIQTDGTSWYVIGNN